MDGIRLALLVAQIVAIPVFAITIGDLYRKALDAYNAELKDKNLAPLSEDTAIVRTTQHFIMFGAKVSVLAPEARRRILRMRFWLGVAGVNMALLAANIFMNWGTVR